MDTPRTWFELEREAWAEFHALPWWKRSWLRLAAALGLADEIETLVLTRTGQLVREEQAAWLEMNRFAGRDPALIEEGRRR